MKKLFLLLLFLYLPIKTETVEKYLASAHTAMEEKNVSEAILYLTKAYTADEHNPQTTIKLANMHYYNFEFDKAAFYFEQFLKKHSKNKHVIFNLAAVYTKSGKFDKAINLFEQIPSDSQTQGELLKLYLRNADWHKAQQILHAPDYDTDMSGKKVLIELDLPGNGYGDAIQFIRIAKQLKNNGAYVIAHTKKALIPLLKNCLFIDELCSDNSRPDADITFNLCIGSLMINAHKNFSYYRTVPYIFPDDALCNFWRKKLSSDHNLKIGLCFESNIVRNKFTGETLLSLRSIAPSELEPLSLVPTISFYSLQLFAHSSNVSWMKTFDDNIDIHNGRFMDTAAIMKNMDLIITIDTSLAHLAGALGVPVWLLLSTESDYRWFLNSSHSPWYPTMRIFRQTDGYNWEPVVKKIKNELESLVLP